MITPLLAAIGVLIGLQIDTTEWHLLGRRYHYKIRLAQWIGYAWSLLLLLGIAAAVSEAWPDQLLASGIALLISLVAIGILTFVTEFLLSKKAPGSAIATWGLRLLVAGVSCAVLEQLLDTPTHGWLLAYVAAGLFLRKSPFGIPYRKAAIIASYIKRPSEFAPQPDPQQEQTDPAKTVSQDSQRQYVVTEHGVKANTNEDQTGALNALIDRVGTAGGGVLFFPTGKYCFRTSSTNFIRINHSNICLMGEKDREGNLTAELVCCGEMSDGKKNPWLSPFLITTGEQLQPSNEFFGLQFKNKQKGFTQSNSLSDPGSDGEILTPTLCTTLTESAKAGSRLLHVADATKVGRYILIGLYNTTADGNLIKEILGVEKLRPEWTMALRAGKEEAPSYQWLVEVKQRVDDHTIELCRPLLRDLGMEYAPALYNVEMLENISICDLKLSSRWNGRFRHHGFPLYYNIRQAQEMDYGWNAINMKRVAHGSIRNVIIRDFTNPLYVLDSRDVTVRDIDITGHDGHQGIKIYQHACDNLFERIRFRNHFADMMGGEGNAYGNIFRQIEYLNPLFNPVDFDFHGFSEGPMSPPSDNRFEHINGFRYLKGAGSITHLPSMAQRNLFVHLRCEGERRGDSFYYAMTYRPKTGLIRLVTAIGFAAAMIQKKKAFTPSAFLQNVREKLASIDATNIGRSEHKQFFKGTVTEDIDTWCQL